VPSLHPHSLLPFDDIFTTKAFSPALHPSLACAAPSAVQLELIHVPSDTLTQGTAADAAVVEEVAAAAAKVEEANEYEVVDLSTAEVVLVTGDDEDVAALDVGPDVD
jgi:hypothetical protein